jgi:glutamyl-tRNA synthetase
MVRLRFAPSPTGYLHVGGLRTALFSYLYARQQGGTFLFRLEDTDQQRLVEGSEQDLLAMLRWAGVDCDEGPTLGGDFGPYRQSERLSIYRTHLEQLVAQNHAYACFCTQERLDSVKRMQKAQGLIPKYDGHCRDLPQPEVTSRIDAGEAHVYRMRLPDETEKVLMDDLIRGKVVIDTNQLDDQVLLKSDGFPTYHLACVIDDHLMQISHVVRGEEWLPSFPKHLLLYRYFGWEPPQFAHLPLILNPDRSKLSKRQGDVAVEDFKAQGYVAEALVNFIALLGWNTSDDQEIFSMQELVEKFSFERVGKAGAVFDRNKLEWMNQQYIQKLDLDDLMSRLQPYLAASAFAENDPDLLRRAVQIVQPSLTRLPLVLDKLAIFFDDKPKLDKPELIEYLKQDEARTVLQNFREQLDAADTLDEASFKQLVKATQKTVGIKGKGLWTPLRYAITLEEHGPDLSMMAAFFGKEKCLRLLDDALGLA